MVLPNDDIDIVTIIGKPIDIPKIENPTNEDIDKYHSLYIHSLRNYLRNTKTKVKIIH
jgi:hypothetical protein